MKHKEDFCGIGHENDQNLLVLLRGKVKTKSTLQV